MDVVDIYCENIELLIQGLRLYLNMDEHFIITDTCFNSTNDTTDYTIRLYHENFTININTRNSFIFNIFYEDFAKSQDFGQIYTCKDIINTAIEHRKISKKEGFLMAL